MLDPNVQAAFDTTLLAVNNARTAVLVLTQDRDDLMIERDDVQQQLSLATQTIDARDATIAGELAALQADRTTLATLLASYDARIAALGG